MRCDIHPPFFPYVITRLEAETFVQEPLSRALPEQQLRAIAARRSQESGYETSLVVNPFRAVFYHPDGRSSESTLLPFGGQLILRSPLGDLELVDLGTDEEEPFYSGCKVDDDPARIMARDMVAWLRDQRGLECSFVATTRDPEQPGILVSIIKSDQPDDWMVEYQIRADLPVEYRLLVRWDTARRRA